MVSIFWKTLVVLTCSKVWRVWQQNSQSQWTEQCCQQQVFIIRLSWIGSDDPVFSWLEFKYTNSSTLRRILFIIYCYEERLGSSWICFLWDILARSTKSCERLPRAFSFRWLLIILISLPYVNLWQRIVITTILFQIFVWFNLRHL